MRMVGMEWTEWSGIGGMGVNGRDANEWEEVVRVISGGHEDRVSGSEGVDGGMVGGREAGVVRCGMREGQVGRVVGDGRSSG